MAANSASTAVCSKTSDSIRQSSVRYSTTAGLPGEITAPDGPPTAVSDRLLVIWIFPLIGKHTATEG
jgi:hypothetical protein